MKEDNKKTEMKYPEWAMERWERRLRKKIYKALWWQGILQMKGISKKDFFYKFKKEPELFGEGE